MRKLSLQQRLVRYLQHTHGYINGGELEKIAEAAGYKGSTASRRLRVLEEASRGIMSTPEHIRAAQILRYRALERVEKKGPDSRVASVWYRLVEKAPPPPKFKYVPSPDGKSMIEVST
jgi:hypothetical protein